jgi:hypothetical protein
MLPGAVDVGVAVGAAVEGRAGVAVGAAVEGVGVSVGAAVEGVGVEVGAAVEGVGVEVGALVIVMVVLVDEVPQLSVTLSSTLRTAAGPVAEKVGVAPVKSTLNVGGLESVSQEKVKGPQIEGSFSADPARLMEESLWTV